MGQSSTTDENSRPQPTSSAAAETSKPSANPLATPANDETKTINTAAPESSSTPAPEESAAISQSVESTPSAAITEAGPVLVITLLLGSGARHPYKIDEKYLTKRNVDVPGVTEGGRKDPFSISVYTLKELILREWREEWEAQPSSPSSIRLIYFGRLLDDKTPLRGILSLLQLL